MQSHRLFPAALLLVTAVLWSLGGVLVKSIDWNPMAIAGARSAIALPVIIACVGWPGVRFSRLQIGGAIAYAGTVIFFVLATRLTTAANAIFLQYTAPIYVAIAAFWWLGERTRRIDWVVIGVALCGIAVFFFDELTTEGFWGIMAALASGVAFASLVLCLRKDRAGSPVAAVMLGNFITAVIGLPFMVSSQLPGLPSWIALAVLGTVQLGISYVLYTIAIKRVTAMEATLIPLLEPILNPLWVMLLVGELPGPWATVGGALVIGAVLVRGMVMLRRPAVATAH
jgi:drug/metabolite transporter (DMT)-like permease